MRLAPRRPRQERLAREQAERERLAKEKAERERQERLAREQAERERLAKAKAERERQARLAREKAERERIAKEKAEQERIAAITRQMRDEQLQRAAGLAGSGRSQGNAAVARGPSASYGAKVVAAVKPNIIFTGRLAQNPAAVVEVKTAANGEIIGRRLVRSSGVAAWDNAVLRAVDRTRALPLDENGSVPSPLQISFRPND
jgi:colicin import membrane protein